MNLIFRRNDSSVVSFKLDVDQDELEQRSQISGYQSSKFNKKHKIKDNKFTLSLIDDEDKEDGKLSLTLLYRQRVKLRKIFSGHRRRQQSEEKIRKIKEEIQKVQRRHLFQPTQEACGLLSPSPEHPPISTKQHFLREPG